MEKLKQLLIEYGWIALSIYLLLFLAVFIGSFFAIHAGWNPQGVAGNAGAWAAAYIVTKLTQPIRIAATLLLTPIAGRLWPRRTNTPP